MASEKKAPGDMQYVPVYMYAGMHFFFFFFLESTFRNLKKLDCGMKAVGKRAQQGHPARPPRGIGRAI